MSFLMTNNLFNFFGKFAKEQDTYKDGNGKGIWERYQESLGSSYDAEIQPLLDLLLENILVPDTMLSKMIPTMERVLGEPVNVLEDGTSLSEDLRRKIIKFAHVLYNIRSTKLSYQMLFNLVGIQDVEIQEFVVTTGFDSDLTFDDDERVFDTPGGCNYCRGYAIVTTGGITLTSQIIAGIARIINFLEPINARLKSFTYNGVEYELIYITIFIQDGILYYDNANDPGLTLQLIDGILYKDGISAGAYTFDGTDGQLYIIT